LSSLAHPSTSRWKALKSSRNCSNSSTKSSGTAKLPFSSCFWVGITWLMLNSETSLVNSTDRFRNARSEAASNSSSLLKQSNQLLTYSAPYTCLTNSSSTQVDRRMETKDCFSVWCANILNCANSLCSRLPWLAMNSRSRARVFLCLAQVLKRGTTSHDKNTRLVAPAVAMTQGFANQ